MDGVSPNKQRETETQEVTGSETANLSIEHLIEQLRQRSAELEEANRELRRVSHYRSLFLARMSHELRTPLTSILGFSEILLEQEQLTDIQRRFCQKIQDSGFQLQASLNQLVDLSRLEAGETELFLQEFFLRETLRESCAAVARFAQKQQVKVEYDLAAEVATVVSDQGKLRQILYNFLAWAVSRSEPGQSVRLYAQPLVGSVLQIQIDDQGKPVKDLRRIFDPYDASVAREADVNQLGMIIGRHLLDVMKGTVQVESHDSGGLSMLIRIPAGPAKG
jgi:signal transduction histidine kinase